MGALAGLRAKLGGGAAEVASLKAELEEAMQVLAQVANEVRALRARQ